MADDATGSAASTTSISDVVAGALPGILKRGKVIVSPYPFGLSDDDNLRVTAVNSVTGVVVNIHTRRVLRDQSVTTDTPSFTPPADRTPTSIDVPLAGGYTTNLSVFASGATPRKGQCFVIVQMIRGLGVSASIIGTLLAGTITVNQAIGWPGSPIESSTDGEPVVRAIIGTQPAATQGWTETVPTGARWELLTFGGLIDPNGGGGTHFVTLQIKDPSANVLWSCFSPQQLIVGPGVGSIFWAQGQFSNAAAASGLVTAPLPDRLTLPAGSQIVTLGAADYNPRAPVYTVREWQEAA